MFTIPFLDLPALSHAKGTVTLPGSKSITNRALLLAALAGLIIGVGMGFRSDLELFLLIIPILWAVCCHAQKWWLRVAAPALLVVTALTAGYPILSASAEGSVKPTHAASPPSSPARSMPIPIDTWLLAGPGRN